MFEQFEISFVKHPLLDFLGYQVNPNTCTTLIIGREKIRGKRDKKEEKYKEIGGKERKT